MMMRRMRWGRARVSSRSAISSARVSVSCHPLEDVLLIDIAQLDLRHVLRLHLIDAEGDHQIGDDLGFLLRLPDGTDGLVDVQQDALQTLQQVQLVLLLLQDEEHPALDALGAPSRPLLQNAAARPGHGADRR